MAAPDRRSVPSVVSTRRYITFRNPVRILHQNVGRTLDVRQWIFDEAQVLDCRNGSGRSEIWPGGWVCVTVIQSGDGVPGSGPIQGSMALDIVSGNEKIDSTFYSGNIISSKTVSSVVTSPGAEGGMGTLLTLVADSGTLQLTKVEHAIGPHVPVRGGVIESDDVIETTPAHPSQIVGPSSGGFPAASSEERRRDKDKSGVSTTAAVTHEEGRRRAFESMNGSVHSSRGERSNVSGSSGSGGGSKQKERRRQEEECSPRGGGGESKRQKTHHDPRTDRDPESSSSSAPVVASRAPVNVEGNLHDDGVSFLNNYASGSVVGAVDGALPSPMVIETPGFNDLILESEDEDRHRSAAAVRSSTAAGGSDDDDDGGIAAAAAVATIVGTGRDDVDGIADVQSLNDSRTVEPAVVGGGGAGLGIDRPGSEGAGVSDGGGGNGGGRVHRREEELSNTSALPPVLQIEEGSSRSNNPSSDQPFEGVFDSLMRLLNECKDKSGKMTPAGGPSDPNSLVAPASGTGRFPTLEDLLGRPSKPVLFNRAELAPKPVCEIRPFVEATRNAAAIVPPVATSRGRGGSNRRRAPASTARASRPRRARQTRSASGNRGRSASGRSRRGQLVEDEVEVIEVSDAPTPSVEEETAMAAAMLEDLIDLDYDYD